MSSIYLILNWVTGLFFALLGLLVFFSGAFLAGIPLIITSFLFLPPIQKIIAEKTKKIFSIKAKTISTLALFIVSMTFLTIHIEAEKEATEGAIINEFTQNKQQIITSIENKFEIKSYQTVINEIDKYSIINDKNLNQLRAKAEIGLKVKQVLSRLEKLPEDNVQGKVRSYQELVILAPDNQNYKDQLAYFKKIIEAQRLAQIEKELKEKESKLLSVLEELPEDNTQGQIKSYQALVNLLPDNQGYKDQLAHFEKVAETPRLERLEKEREERAAEILAKLKIIPKDNIWDFYNSYELLTKLYPDNKEYEQAFLKYKKKAALSQLNASSIKTIPYRIIKEERMRNLKASYNIMVDLVKEKGKERLPNKSELKAISQKIKENAGGVERVFVLFYLPAMRRDRGAFATGHHNPNLEVEILSYVLFQTQYKKFITD